MIELSNEAKLHFARNEGRACKRPGNGASKALIKELHERKLMSKHFRRMEDRRGFTPVKRTGVHYRSK